MLRIRLLGAFLVVCLTAMPNGLAAERMTIWLTLDAQSIGPRVACDGQFRIDGGGHIALRPWMAENGDTIEGAEFQMTTGHSPETAAAAKLQRIRRSTLPKGLLLEVDAPLVATLNATTKLGDFDVRLDDLAKQGSVSVLGGKVRLARIPNVEQLTGNKAEEDFASMTVLPDSQAAVSFVAWDGSADQIFLQVGDEVRQVTDAPGDYLDPRCVLGNTGTPWVVWAANDGRQWDLWADIDGQNLKLTTNPLNSFWPRVTRGPGDQVWLVWQTVTEELHYEIMLASLGRNGLSAPINVSQHAADDWEPAVCVTADGRIVVAWDTYRNGSYDIYLREFEIGRDEQPKPVGPPVPVAASAKREAHATLATDSEGRVWLAWDVSMEDWGKHPKVAGTLHAYRDTDVACYEGGKLRRTASDFMDRLPKPFGKFVEYPNIAVDGQDRVWVVWRMSNEVLVTWHDPKLSRGGQNYAIWSLFASQYDGRGWSEPILLGRSNGRQDIRTDVVKGSDGELLVTFAADNRTRQFPYMPVDYDIFQTSLAGFGKPMGELSLADAPDLGQVTPAAPDPELFALPRKWSLSGKKYCLAIGDTHRHTDISRCMNGYDGSLQDAYRYALDACGLDWLAISDHDQDILKHRNDRLQRPRQDYDWWRSQKYCDLYTIPGRFLALYGYEHGGSFKARGGHKNVVLAKRGYPVIEADSPQALFAAMEGSPAVAIPHQLADGGSRTDWEKWNRNYEAVAEIFQTRGSYEYADCPRVAGLFTPGHSIWDALASDVRIGIIASSDHGQTHQARACVYVVDDPKGSGNLTEASGFTRQGIVDALRDRRTFGATIAASFQMSIEGHPLGQEISIDGPPTIEAKIIAPAEITALAVVRDNLFVYTSEPRAAEATLQFHDLDLKPGQSAYYYVRALIGEDDVAWSSPIWVSREK